MNWAEIGGRIRKRREQFGYTREELAEKLDITPKFCADIELGNRGMSIQTLCSISSILKLSTDYILFGHDERAEDGFSTSEFMHCTPLEQKYAEELLKVFFTAMNSKHE